MQITLVPFGTHMFLILIDAHSKWMEDRIMTMRSAIATLGLSEQLVSDNGTCFTSEEFRQFMQNNRVHLSHHPDV